MYKRVILRIEVTAGARDRLAATVDEFGSTNVTVASKLMIWMAHQDETVQAMILGIYPHPSTSDEAAKHALRKIANRESRA